jgi:23S rRNA U2552 (ribose-2'-O)-methylase RlmE/FtsJ
MTYYILPQIEYNIKDSNLKLTILPSDSDICQKEYSLKKYLSKIKGLIDKHINDWDVIKKYTNPYEFIHTTIPGQKVSVSKYKPISRAFFKLVEIYNTHRIFVSGMPIKSFHLAEGPGGFIEATAYMRNNTKDIYYGMTLIDKDGNIPGWKKAEAMMKKYGNINIEYGVDGVGDLYNHENLLYCKEHYKNSMNIITADGGFDFSNDYNNQEKNAFRLIFTQVAYAITMQKLHGTFVLKIFDILEKSTMQVLYLLNCFYETIIITKPYTSRNANSEKYIICKGFKYSDTGSISTKFINILKIFEPLDFNKYTIVSILDIPLQSYYHTHVTEINAILGHKQIDNILNTIKIITHKDRKNEKIQHLKTNNIQKCINWCINNNIPYNKNYQSNNIFLGERTKNFKTLGK